MAALEGPPRLRSPHFPCFDALRALGMVMVLATHVEFTSAAVDKGIAGPFLERMDFGVTLFFMISGFLLYRPFALATFSGAQFGSTRSFLRRRALRVFPGYWLALVVLILFFGLEVDSAWDLAAYALLLFPFDRSLAFTEQVKQAWSLTAEVIFYLLLPPYCFALRRLGRDRSARAQLTIALAGAAVLYVVGLVFRILVVATAPDSAEQMTNASTPAFEDQAAILLPAWIDVIAIGMAMGALSAWVQCGGRLWRPLAWLGDHPGASWAGAIAVFFGITRVEVPNAYVFTAEFVLRYVCYGIVALLLLIPAMFGDQAHGALRRVLRSRPLAFLGTVSLGFYLIHVAVLDDFVRWLDYPPFRASFVTLFVLTFAASLAYAIVSYFGVERPFLRLKDRRRAGLVAPERA